MSEESLAQLRIGKSLTVLNIKTLQSLLRIPAGLCEDITSGIEFIYFLKKRARMIAIFFTKAYNQSVGQI